jgi:hypothetical protein
MSRVKPKRALVGRPDGLVIAAIAWKTWKISEWASMSTMEPDPIGDGIVVVRKNKLDGERLR